MCHTQQAYNNKLYIKLTRRSMCQYMPSSSPAGSWVSGRGAGRRARRPRPPRGHHTVTGASNPASLTSCWSSTTAPGSLGFLLLHRSMLDFESRVGKGNLVLRHSIPPLSAAFFEVLGIEWRKSTPDFCLHVRVKKCKY